MRPVKAAHAEVLPGYRLLEFLGKGGVGEVWKCEAPGGFLKAIKFVAGDLDGVARSGEAAQKEFKALQLLKAIRHPFLLNVERVEVVDGELLIVTELADRNLRDVLSMNLSLAGHEVVTASDGPQGLDSARRRHPEVVVLDVISDDRRLAVSRRNAGFDFAPHEPLSITLELWSAAHGIASLMICKPFLPWGDTEAIADRVLCSAALGHVAGDILGGDPTTDQVLDWLKGQRP